MLSSGRPATLVWRRGQWDAGESGVVCEKQMLYCWVWFPSPSCLRTNLLTPVYMRQVGKPGHFISKHSVVTQVIRKHSSDSHRSVRFYQNDLWHFLLELSTPSFLVIFPFHLLDIIFYTCIICYVLDWPTGIVLALKQNKNSYFSVQPRRRMQKPLTKMYAAGWGAGSAGRVFGARVWLLEFESLISK